MGKGEHGAPGGEKARVLSQGDAMGSSVSEPVQLSRLQRLASRGYLLASRITRGMTLGTRAIALDATGRVFLVRHGYTPGWHLPGGGVDPGETLEEAVLREIAEEGNLQPGTPPRLLSIHLNRRVSRRDHVALFLLEGVTQSRPRAPDREIVASGFFPPEGLPPDTTGATRRRLAEALEGRPPDPHW